MVWCMVDNGVKAGAAGYLRAYAAGAYNKGHFLKR